MKNSPLFRLKKGAPLRRRVATGARTGRKPGRVEAAAETGLTHGMEAAFSLKFVDASQFSSTYGNTGSTGLGMTLSLCFLFRYQPFYGIIA